jgi:methylthioribulose-1-phosphate dehydratase
MWALSILIYRNAIYIAPSGVQKERIKSDDLFVQDITGKDLKVPPVAKKLKKTQCTPLFMCAYTGNISSLFND